jgi:GxxExxY protein
MKKKLVKTAEEVFDTLGPGYVEKVYQGALAHELRLRDIPHQREYNTQLLYKKHELGIIRVDLVVDGNLVVELKALKKISESHKKQVRAYLISTGLPKGILVNFPSDRDEIDVFDEVLDETALVTPECTYKGKAIEKIAKAAEEVANNLGAEFFYQPKQKPDYYLKALKTEFRLCELPYEERTFELLYKDFVVDEGSYLIADKRYLLDVISAKEIDEYLIEGYRWEWKVTGLKQGILVNIQPDTAVVEIERFKI